MRRCKKLYDCLTTARVSRNTGTLLCEIFMCWDYEPIDIDNDWKPFMDNLNRSLGDWKSYCF